MPGLFTSAVSIFAAGSSFRWLRGVLSEGDSLSYDEMTALAATSPIGANKLLFNPSLGGGSCLEPSPHIRGAFVGLDLRHTRADLIRAGMEGIALNLGAVLEVLRGFVPLSREMLMVGGGSKSPFWLQIFADIYRMECVKTNIDQDAAALGAAALAAVGAGLWKGFEKVDEVHKVQGVQKPIPANVEKYRRLMPAFEMLRRHQAELGDLLHTIDF
jgi:xylulokinase